MVMIPTDGQADNFPSRSSKDSWRRRRTDIRFAVRTEVDHTVDDDNRGGESDHGERDGEKTDRETEQTLRV